MKVLVTGGTGFVGSDLTRRLVSEGHRVTVLTRGGRDGSSPEANPRFLKGDPTKEGPWQEAVADHQVLVNLAGTSIFGRWNDEYKRSLRESRLLTTRHLVEAIPSGAELLLLSASGAGYYGFHGDEELDESAGPGRDFLATLAADWEAEALKAGERGARVVITRFGIVLGRGGGALRQMITPFKWFVGGPLGDGLQWLSWIHVEDLVAAILHLLALPEASGPYNLTSPYPVRNRDFSKELGRVLGRPSWLPAPGFMMRLVLGEFGSVILKGQRVLPRRLLESGFSFRYPRVDQALRDLLGST
jgi:uncharacterized protein (TIGR01777 family)